MTIAILILVIGLVVIVNISICNYLLLLPVPNVLCPQQATWSQLFTW
jgi:hypothetical protein